MKSEDKKVKVKKVEKKVNFLPWEYILIGFVSLLFIALLIYTLIPKNSSSVKLKEDIELQVSQQALAQASPQGTITFCFRLNGREDMHLPALLGAAGDDIYPNGLAGFNWSLPPASTGDEHYGILPDGTIFIKKDFLERWSPNLVEIKSDITGWAPVKLKLDEINGNSAYIYKR